MDREKIATIGALKKTLRDLGYYQFQVNDLIAGVTGTPDLSRCTPAQLDEVIAALEEQVAFALQCLNPDKPS
jgi:hypothetical protein